jgi:hypothetical protein
VLEAIGGLLDQSDASINPVHSEITFSPHHAPVAGSKIDLMVIGRRAAIASRLFAGTDHDGCAEVGSPLPPSLQKLSPALCSAVCL